MHLPVVITTPHNSGVVPQDILMQMLGERAGDPEAREQHLKHIFHEGDPYTDMIFQVEGATHFHALASRFVVDLNRARDEGGRNGVIKMTDFNETPLYPKGFSLSADEVEARLRRYYDPYHTLVAEAIARPEVCFFIDGHCMTPTGPCISPDTGLLRPALSIITCGDTSGNPLLPDVPTSLPSGVARDIVALLARHFEPIMKLEPEVPAEVRINDPFPAATISSRYSHPSLSWSKPGFSLEINRGLYLEPTADGLSRPIPGRIKALNRAFNGFVQEALGIFARV